LLEALIRTPLSVTSWGWWIAFAAVTVATAIDWNTRRIPNFLTFPLALLALVLNGVLGGGMGLAGSAIGLVFGLGMFLIFMALGAMGAGDVKLMAALGALLGVVHIFWIGLFTAAMGGLLVVFYSLGQRSLPRLLHRTATLLQTAFLTGRLPKAEELSARREDYMPYALAIALGVVAQYLYRGGS
jgi:prepilin peptidase CpaA